MAVAAVDRLAGRSCGVPTGSPSARSIMVPLERLDELPGWSARPPRRTCASDACSRTGSRSTQRPRTEFNELSRLLNDLQDRAMRTQMVPVSTITDQLHRAVRDLSRAQGKDVRWEARGTDTELDRGVLHQLSDSLLHLVRNAVDHGIEPPDEREAAGKPAQATVRLHAMQLGSEVIIAVTDDGRGIDVDSVTQQADRRGIDTDGMTERRASAADVSTGPVHHAIRHRRLRSRSRPRRRPDQRRGRSRPGRGAIRARRRHRVPDHRPDHPGRPALPARRGRRPALRPAVPPRVALPGQ